MEGTGWQVKSGYWTVALSGDIHATPLGRIPTLDKAATGSA